MSDTVRSLLEEIAATIPTVPQTGQAGSWLHSEKIAELTRKAQAAIDLIDKAQYARIPVSEYGDYCCDCGSGIDLWDPRWGYGGPPQDIIGRFIPDPPKEN